MAELKVGDKVVFKKEVLDKININEVAESAEGISLTPQYYNWFLDNTSFRQVGYFTINDISQGSYDIGLYIGKDLFQSYQEHPHNYQIGDIVRIKKREGDSSSDYPCGFSNYMSTLTGAICKIYRIYTDSLSTCDSKCKYFNGDRSIYKLICLDLSDKRDFGYDWHSSMFELVAKPQEIQLQTSSLKEGDLVPICGIVGKINIDSRYYLDFDNIKDDQEHISCCKKLRELVPNFDKIADKVGAVLNTTGLFPEFSTIDELMRFVQAINAEYNSKQPTILKKSENYEIRFQKPKTSSIRGFVPTGRAICGRRCKTTIKLGHLSNTTCHC